MDDRALVERQLGRPPARVPSRSRPLSVRRARGHGAGAVRRRRRPVPDHVLPHLSAARRGGRPARGCGRRGALERGSSSAIPTSQPTSSAPRRSSARLRRELAAGRTGRDDGSSLELGIGGSANPRRLKCLHAHAAYALANPGYRLGERVLAEVDPLWPPQRCCSDPLGSTSCRSPRPRSRARGASGRTATAACSSRHATRRRATGCLRRSTRLLPSFAAASAASSRSGARGGLRARRAMEPRGRAGTGACAGLAADALDRRGGGVPPLRARRPGLQAVSTRQRPAAQPRVASPAPAAGPDRCSASLAALARSASRSAARSRTALRRAARRRTSARSSRNRCRRRARTVTVTVTTG